MDKLIPEEILKQLSYTSTLGQSLKQISLRNTPLDKILLDVDRYRDSHIEMVVQENLIGTRFKSTDSIIRKYQKTLKNNGGFKQCFNDVLGFRLYFEEYPQEFPLWFRVVDLRQGKNIDDGYRAIHLYYQRDNSAYPIELQLWCGKDYEFNIWSHTWVYKYEDAEIGRKLYHLYSAGMIKTEADFLQELKRLRSDE